MNFFDSGRRVRLFSVIDRMIAVDLSKTLVSVLSVIVLIIVSRRSLKILGKAIEGEISSETILSIIGLKIVVALITFLPPAFFLAVLMVLGRMHRDNEMAALSAGGVGVGRIYRAILAFAVPLVAVGAAGALYLMPWSEAKTEQIYQQDQQGADLRVLAAGRFSEFRHGDLVVYAEDISSDQVLRNIFVQQRKGGELTVVTAAHGRVEDLPGGRYAVLEQGEQVEGNPGEKEFSITRFSEYAVKIEEPSAPFIVYDREAVASVVLLQSDNRKDIAELQSRLSIPLGILVLGILAVPLAQVAPRGGVYGNLVAAFLIYVAYGNLLRIVHSWVVKEVAPVWLGYVGVYLVVVLLVGYLLFRALGREWIMQSLTGKAIR